MTLKVIHRLQAFSNAIRQTFVQHFTRFQLTVCSHGSSALAELLVTNGRSTETTIAARTRCTSADEHRHPWQSAWIASSSEWADDAADAWTSAPGTVWAPSRSVVCGMQGPSAVTFKLSTVSNAPAVSRWISSRRVSTKTTRSNPPQLCTSQSHNKTGKIKRLLVCYN